MAEVSEPQVGGILLAAGSSTRMGRSKQLVEFEGTKLIRGAATAMIGSLCRPRLVVIGSDADRCRRELTGLDIDICLNDDWAAGMSSSIKAGLTQMLEADDPIEAVIITLCDQPYISENVIDRFIEEYRRLRPPIIASEYNGISGVPALFSSEIFGEILKLEGDKGARDLIRGAGDRALQIRLPEAAFDIDSPDDLEQLEKIA